jgi:hypothetical protein
MRAILAAFIVCALSAPVDADDTFIAGSDGWTTYVNERFGMHFDYPDGVFAPLEPPENGDGRTFKAEDATLEIFAFENIDGETAASLEAQLVGAEGYTNVTYSPSGDSWLVLSGFRGDMIFYEKYLFAGDFVAAFGMEFPAAAKPFYAPIVERIENSFRAD